MNREAIELAEQNPGSGRPRFYSALGVVKLSVMRRVSDLRMDLSIAKEIAGEVERMLIAEGEVPWDLHIAFRPEYATENTDNFSIIRSSDYSIISKYGAINFDARDMQVSHFTEPFESMFQRRKHTDGRPIDPIRRDFFAKRGFHAEPVVIFPLGEIVNGALLQLQALRPFAAILTPSRKSPS